LDFNLFVNMTETRLIAKPRFREQCLRGNFRRNVRGNPSECIAISACIHYRLPRTVRPPSRTRGTRAAGTCQAHHLFAPFLFNTRRLNSAGVSTGTTSVPTFNRI